MSTDADGCILVESNDAKDADGCIGEQFRFVWLVRRPGLEHFIDMAQKRVSWHG